MDAVIPFPVRTSSFLGRDADLEALATLLQGPDRLVTILGPGGIGKTRFATEAARSEHLRANAGTEGPWLCDLSSALTAANICTCLASALDVPLAGSSVASQVAQLGYALASRPRALVVFDNFEQIVDHAPATIVRWLSMAEGARFLVTSRERLRVPGEIVFDLDPLSVPQPGDDPLASDAVRLFFDRSRGSSRIREPLPDDVASVAEIVRRLDGMPLAIELAASRASVLTPSSLLARLARPFELLSLGQRGVSNRHATLASTIEWSWNLLPPPEREALAQCSVFSGGFALEAAEEILVLPPAASGEPSSVLDVLHALRDASLLRAHATSVANAETRLGMFETIRDFAHDKLVASGGLAAALRRHAAYYLREGQAWAEGLLGPRGHLEARRLELERHNLEAIVRRALAMAPPSVPAANEALTAMRILEPPAFSGLAADRGGLLTPVLRYVDAAVRSSSAEPNAATAAALGVDCSSWAHCWMARGRVLLDQFIPEAREARERTLTLAREARDARMEGIALLAIAAHSVRAAQDEDTWSAALTAAQRALDFRYEGDERGKAYVMACQAYLSCDMAQFPGGGSVDRLEELAERTLELLRRSGNRLMEGVIESILSISLAASGLLIVAHRHGERALPICTDFGNTWGVAGMHVCLGTIAFERGELGRAIAELELAVPAARRSGQKAWEGQALTLLGMLHHQQVRPTEARKTLELAISAHRDSKWPIGMGASLGALCMVEAAELRLDEAEDLRRRSDDQLAQAPRDADHGITELLPGFLEVARATLASKRDDEAQALVWVDTARARAVSTARSESYRRSGTVRLFTRLLERAVDAVTSRDRSLLMGAEAAWFQPPGGARVKVSGTSPRLILLHLTKARELSPGTAVPRAQLVRVGWPEQRAARDAMERRLFVAISTLRRLGLGSLVVTHEDGWLLDPLVPLVWAR